MSLIGLAIFIVIVGTSSVYNRVRKEEADRVLKQERRKIHETIKTLHKTG